MKPFLVNIQEQNQDSIPVLAQVQPTEKVDNTNNKPQQKPVKPSQQDDLIALANRDFVLFHTPDKEPYAKACINNRRMVMHLRSDEFKKFLGFKYHQAHRKVPHRQGLDDAIQLLIGKAIYESPEEEVFIRTAPYGGNIIVDLSNNQGHAVEISESDWRIITNPPVNFLRVQSQQPLLLPKKGGTLDDFRPFINTQTEEDLIMTMAHLIFTLHPTGPYPVLIVNGDAGSCKSTGVHMIKNIVDPSTAVNFTMPKNVRDVFINASKTWLVTYDNISTIPKWFSDNICRIATGASHGTKKNYTDGDEYQITIKRPIILAGIGDLVARGDLASRAITVHMKNIEGTESMKTEDQIWDQFTLKQPYLLGWIFDALSAGLRNLHLINDRYPRMADFSRFLAAVDRNIWTPGTFNKAYRSNMSKVVKQVIETDPIASSVIAMMQDQTDCMGTAEEALIALSRFINNTSLLKSKEWPQAPNKLRKFLEKSESLLKKEGIALQFDILGGGRKFMRIYKPSLPVSESITAPIMGHGETEIEIAENPDNHHFQDLPLYSDINDDIIEAESELIRIKSEDQAFIDFASRLSPDELSALKSISD